MGAMLMDAKAMTDEVSAMASHLKAVLADDTLEPEQVAQVHDALVTATEALTEARKIVRQ